MDKDNFKRLLFKVAFCTMACDGYIDEREINELMVMDTSTTFFDGISLTSELNQLVADFTDKGKTVIKDMLEELKSAALNPLQEMIILEVSLRIINADEKHDENEIKFVNLLRSKLKLHDEIILDRFGKIDILYTYAYADSKISLASEEKLLETLQMPEIASIKDIKFEIKKES